MKIITITLNPAFDVHCNIDNLQLYKENYASAVVRHAGGKGVNISRALCRFGVDNTALCVVGESGGEEFLNSLRNDGIICKYVTESGRIRENITIHSLSGETRISFEGFKLSEGTANKLYTMIEQEYEPDTIVTFAGRLCDGITRSDAVQFLLSIKRMGVKVMVDCNSFTKEDLLQIKPFLIKPNEQEIGQLLGVEISNEADALNAAKSFYDKGIENVIISLGARGFVFYGENGGYIVNVPVIEPVSTIGAGDSLIAGFVVGVSFGSDVENTLKSAAAFGTAACLAEGTNPPEKDVVSSIKDKICVHKITEV